MNSPNKTPEPAALPIETVCKYCPRCGNENKTVDKVPFRCESCGFSNFFGPVAAVGGLVVNDQQQILLVRRARDPGKGQWGLPGGFVDRNETAEEALAREIVEETQLVMTSCQLLLTQPNLYNYHGVVAPVIDLFYVCEVIKHDKVILAQDELELFEWARPNAKHLENMAFESNKLALEKWLELN